MPNSSSDTETFSTHELIVTAVAVSIRRVMALVLCTPVHTSTHAVSGRLRRISLTKDRMVARFLAGLRGLKSRVEQEVAGSCPARHPRKRTQLRRFLLGQHPDYHMIFPSRE